MGPDGLEYVAKLGDTADVAEGQAAARLCTINILAQAKAALGDLDRIKQVVKIQGFVNSTPDFMDHPGGDQRRIRFPRGCSWRCRAVMPVAAVGMASPALRCGRRD